MADEDQTTPKQASVEGLCVSEGLNATKETSSASTVPVASSLAAVDKYAALSDAEIVALVRGGKLKDHQVVEHGRFFMVENELLDAQFSLIHLTSHIDRLSSSSLS
jgi:hypothetical protein